MTLLPWLPALSDFSAELKAARALETPADRLKAAVRLSGFARDFVATERIDKLAQAALAELAAAGAQPNGLLPMRLAVLASHTVDHLAPAIRVSGLSRRLALSFYVAPYGMYRQAALGGDHQLAQFAPQLILFALDESTLPFDLPLASTETEIDAAVDAWVTDLRQLWRSARDRFSAQIVQQTILSDRPSLFGSFDGLVPASAASIVERANAALRRAARDEGILLLDLALQLPPEVDGIRVIDPVRWHQAKQLINPAVAPLYGDLLARIAAAIGGLSKKCLVLDLDNTLWGGVIGDDGIDGIKLGQGDAEGEAFLAVQRYAARLGQRGVILAVCSKNTLSVAEAAFAEHPEMVIKRSDIACFVANWEDKATNLRYIAKTLNIGLDSLVFVDDNPVEREIIRRELPEVGVPELPEDPAFYPQRVATAGYFEAVSLTADDLARGKSYALNAERQAALEQATDMEGYLKSLDMVMTAHPIDEVDLPRAAQLLNKTNQFNLTTRRRTEAELQALLGQNDVVSLSVRLADRFGDNGLISVILARPDAECPDDSMLIDTWLMSCRVLGRQVEVASLGALAKLAGNAGYKALIGEYRPTAKNGMVADHFPRLGFQPVDPLPGAEPEARFWRYELGTPLPEHFIRMSEDA